MQNIEVKTRFPDLNAIPQNARNLGARFCWTRHQRDTYFNAPNARVKLRECSGQPVELIEYYRRNLAGSRVSYYTVTQVPDLEQVRQELRKRFGELVVVEKSRELHVYGQTRIHLDVVAELGPFVELETVIGDRPYELLEAEHRVAFTALGLDNSAIEPLSYSDLLLELRQLD